MDNTTSVDDAHPPPSTDVRLPTCALTSSRREFRWKETVAQPPKQLCWLRLFALIVLFNVKKESHSTSEGRFRGQETLWITSPLSAQKERGEKANYGWRWWWKACVAHSRQATCPSKMGFPSVSPPSALFYLLSLPSCLFCSAWGTSSGSDLTCHESTVIPPLQVTCPVCVRGCVCVLKWMSLGLWPSLNYSWGMFIFPLLTPALSHLLLSVPAPAPVHPPPPPPNPRRSPLLSLSDPAAGPLTVRQSRSVSALFDAHIKRYTLRLYSAI